LNNNYKKALSTVCVLFIFNKFILSDEINENQKIFSVQEPRKALLFWSRKPKGFLGMHSISAHANIKKS